MTDRSWLLSLVVALTLAGLAMMARTRGATRDGRDRNLNRNHRITRSRSPTMAFTPGALPTRSGPRPQTTNTNPHTQLDQNAPEALQQQVAEFMFGLPCVKETPSMVSVPGARAMWLEESCRTGPSSAFMVGREFCHLHPSSDGSLHLNLPESILEIVIDKGWAENHPLAVRGVIPRTVVMVYGPRDETELQVVKDLIAASHAFAHPR